MSTTDPRAMIDEAPMSRAQVIAVAITSALSALDGYDILAISFAAPGISRDWGLGKAELGVVFSSGLIGMALGSLLLAPLADRIGRRRMVLTNLILMMVGMSGAAFAHDIASLSAWRVVTGLGIGAMVPTIVPLAVEFANRRRRMLCMAIMSIGYPIGGTIGGFIAAGLLHWYHWSAVFLFGGVMALLLLAAVFLWLPEPLAFLMARREDHTLDRVNAMLRRFAMPPVAALPAPAGTTAIKPAPYRQIFARGQRAATLRVTAVNLLFMMAVYYLLSWMPQLVADLGYPPSTATVVAALASLGGLIASIALGICAPRLELRRLVGGLMIGLGIAIPVFGFAPAALPLLMLVGLTAGAFLYSSITGLYAVIVETFDPHMRATGVGFVMGIGRVSGALSPLISGALFTIGSDRGGVSVLQGAMALLAGLIIYMSAPASPRR